MAETFCRAANLIAGSHRLGQVPHSAPTLGAGGFSADCDIVEKVIVEIEQGTALTLNRVG
ncbi:hypothetical protein GCM10007989_15840 [Devosia pacifica]|uniref:Uncharacterized protein n=1 Tax=Devosia pacifica TaxID=1335967 RepID=A0A918S4T2_9HYPH|nr:hypothetical protein GCM10007989_15840 [Devosia pacifica]